MRRFLKPNLNTLPYRARTPPLYQITQGVASLALGYALVGLSARNNALKGQPDHSPGLSARWAFSPLYLKAPLYLIFLLLQHHFCLHLCHLSYLPEYSD